MNKNLRNSLLLFSIFLFTITYFELIFKIRILTINSEMAVFRILLFTLSYTVLIMFFLKFFSPKTMKILTYVILSFVTFLYVNQELYFSFFKGIFLTISTASDIGLGWSFLSKYLRSMNFGQLLYLLPIIITIGLSKYKMISFDISYKNLKMPLYFLTAFIFTYFISINTINEVPPHPEIELSYSEMDIFTNLYDSQAAIKKFGLLTYSQRDFFNIFKLDNDPLTEDQREDLINAFFESRTKHQNNAYTDQFEGKNLILITAESLDTFAINETLTPNLYNMMENHSYFENYYSPLHYRSTADTEFQVQTSYYPDKNVTLSMSAYMDNAFPYTMPKMFEELGYETFSFHNYTDYFYPRTKFHEETLGYNYYFGGVDLGMFAEEPTGIVNNHAWQSDLEMMEKAIPYFIEEEQFFVNMLTVSGHLNYTSGHEIGSQHEDTVRQYEIDNGITLDNEMFWYLAANIELDLALGHLLTELENAGRLEDTVIVIFGDHYAYGIDDNVIWDYDDIKEDNDDMDLHNVPFIVVNNDPAITIFDNNKEAFMSSIDIMPTLANLFNLDLDYSKVFGHDALSNTQNVVRFADLSFVSEGFKYHSISEEYEIYSGNVDDLYLLKLKEDFMIEYFNNVSILQNDYFKEDDE